MAGMIERDGLAFKTYKKIADPLGDDGFTYAMHASREDFFAILHNRMKSRLAQNTFQGLQMDVRRSPMALCAQSLNPTEREALTPLPPPQDLREFSWINELLETIARD